MKMLLEIQDEKVDFFIELLKNFSFIKAKPVSEDHPQLLQEFEEAVKNLNLVKEGKLKAKPLGELLDEL